MLKRAIMKLLFECRSSLNCCALAWFKDARAYITGRYNTTRMNITSIFTQSYRCVAGAYTSIIYAQLPSEIERDYRWLGWIHLRACVICGAVSATAFAVFKGIGDIRTTTHGGLFTLVEENPDSNIEAIFRILNLIQYVILTLAIAVTLIFVLTLIVTFLCNSYINIFKCSTKRDARRFRRLLLQSTMIGGAAIVLLTTLTICIKVFGEISNEAYVDKQIENVLVNVFGQPMDLQTLIETTIFLVRISPPLLLALLISTSIFSIVTFVLAARLYLKLHRELSITEHSVTHNGNIRSPESTASEQHP